MLCLAIIYIALSFSPQRYTVGIVTSFKGASPSISYKVNGDIYSVASSGLRGTDQKYWLVQYSKFIPTWAGEICPLEKNMHAPPKGWTLEEVDSLQLLNARARRDLGL
ncbi:hypothetical protein [Flammeovirga aprica]|uniref:Uncharacterized protein n=1 Tax=Flammeovirga aprica JL-4 TaxID=694437 RepID=A0A7X9S2A2_9BACT|nr:hypothetical protein [Flammeovirga aprica]NME72862.1 hypothetical protein [Flammeovirga aprica JL-4]